MSEVHDSNKKIVDEFRANEGRVGGYFAGKSMLLLHTKGAKTQRKHINPVMYVRDDGRFVIIASKGGAPTNPNWYYNLLANPHVTIEVRTEKFEATAQEVTEEPERTRLYDKMVQMMSSFDDYRHKTKRRIPVILLTPQQ